MELFVAKMFQNTVSVPSICVFLEQNGFLPGVFVPKTAFVELPLVDFGTKQCLIKCFCSKISIGRANVFLFWNKVTSWQEFCSKNLIGLK
jgi:hypothetical protein